MHVQAKSSGVVVGLANARPLSSSTFDYAPPPGLTRWANAPQLPRRGRGRGGGMGTPGIVSCI